MKTHNEIPNYIFWSNFSKYSQEILAKNEPLTPEFCIQKTMEYFPNVPKEAILVTPHFEIPEEYSVYLPIEFKTEVDEFKRELNAKLNLLGILDEMNRMFGFR